jgi:hypothetical protein
MKRLITFLLVPFILLAQKSEFTGKITDSENNSPLPNASILIAGTNYGTVSNLEGIFTLKLSEGSHTLITRYIGYQTDTLKISVPQTKTVVINLNKQAIVFPEIVVTDEDPAYRIIREAIKRKKINKGRGSRPPHSVKGNPCRSFASRCMPAAPATRSALW